MTKHNDVHGEHCDVLVIGSLLGGNIAALELTEKGDGLRISAMWRKRSDRGFAETTWNIERFAWPPRGLEGIQRIFLVLKAMAYAGVGIGSRAFLGIRKSRPSTNAARRASMDSGSAACVMPTASSSKTMAPVYSIAERARRN